MNDSIEVYHLDCADGVLFSIDGRKFLPQDNGIESVERIYEGNPDGKLYRMNDDSKLEEVQQDTELYKWLNFGV